VEWLEDRCTLSAGALDTTFGQGGIVLTHFGFFSNDQGQAVAVQPDGKILVAGSGGSANSMFELARYNPNGSLDTTFGQGGKMSTSFGPGADSANALALQSDGKIVVVGSAYMGAATGTDFAVARYNADGSLDTSFGQGGLVTTNFTLNYTDVAQGVALQADGRIVVVGHTNGGAATGDNFAVVRYNSDGSLDTSFGQGGLVATNFRGTSSDDAYAVAIQSDGRMVLAGTSNAAGNYDFALARYNLDGSLDASFGTGGLLTTDFAGANDNAQAVVLQSDGKIVAAGFATSGTENFALARYNADGSLDTTFGLSGKVMTDFLRGTDVAEGVALQADGKLVAAGFTYPRFSSVPKFALARYNADGSLDTTFGTNGTVTTVLAGNQDVARGVALQSDGKIVMAGYAFDANFNGQFAVVRYTNDLALPLVANAGGPYTVAEGGTVQLDGSQSTDPRQPSSTLIYQWDLDGDGIFGQTGAAATRGDEVGVNPTFSAAGLDGPGTYTVTLKVTDSAGLSSTATATINIVNVPPTVTINGAPASSPEGATISLTSTVTDPSPADVAAGFTLAWTVTKDGAAFATGSGANFAFTPDDNATYIVTLSATDKDGGVGTASQTIAVFNVAPTPTIVGSPSNNPEGSAITLSGTASDPSPVDTAAGFTFAWSVSKNGNAFASGAGANFSFTPDDDGTYTVTLAATDKDGDTGTASQTIDVFNVDPTPTIVGAPSSSPEGSAITLGGMAIDPSPVDTAAGFTFAWSVLKNGNAFASGAGANFSFTPDDNATYVVTLAATDEDGGAGTASQTISVFNVAPTPTIAGAPGSSPEGSAIALTGSATDPSTVDTAAGFTFAWSVLKNGNVFTSGAGASFSFTPDDDGTYLVTLSATDKDGGVGTTSSTVLVTNVPPTPAIGGLPASSPEGTTLSLTASATDPSPVDTAAGFTFAWSVTKNGSAFAAGTGANFSFTPDDDGTYVVALTATDQDGASASTSQTLAVTNVPPNAALNGPATGVRAQPLTFTLTASDPSTVDQAAGFTFTINWDDGTSQTIAGPSGTQVQHAYQASGTYAVNVTATDEDGASGAAAMQTETIQAVQVQGSTLYVGGTSGDDRIIFFQNWQGVRVLLNGVMQGPYSGVTQIVAYGGGGNDVIWAAPNVQIPVTIFGGTGNDILRGGSSPKVLASGEGDDELSGPPGRWCSSHDHATRVANLSGTSVDAVFAKRLNRDTFLKVTGADATVFDDGARDVLWGGPGHNRYFASAGDCVGDPARNHDHRHSC
jgi:uncharacterized delta-60 repeat protein